MSDTERADDHEHDEEKHSKLTQFPLATIKKKMKESPELGNISQEAVLLTAKAVVRSGHSGDWCLHHRMCHAMRCRACGAGGRVSALLTFRVSGLPVCRSC